MFQTRDVHDNLKESSINIMHSEHTSYTQFVFLKLVAISFCQNGIKWTFILMT